MTDHSDSLSEFKRLTSQIEITRQMMTAHQHFHTAACLSGDSAEAARQVKKATDLFAKMMSLQEEQYRIVREVGGDSSAMRITQ